MAKLNQPANFSHALPAAYRTSDTITPSLMAMSSPPLRPISLQASLQSHGNDNLPPSSPHKGSPPSLLSPTDCRTLKKILRDVGHSSPPATPYSVERGEQLFADTDRTGRNLDDSADKDDESYHFSDETVGTGYEDDGDSMELSEGMEGNTMETSNSLPGSRVSSAVSCSNLQPQGSVSRHDSRDRLDCTTHGPLIAEYQEAGWGEPNHHNLTKPLEGDTIEDCMNLPGKCAPPARPQALVRKGLYHRPVPVEISKMDRMRLSTEKILENERVEQECTTLEPEPGVFIPSPDGPSCSKTQAVEQHSVHGTFNFDNEDNATIHDIAKTQDLIVSRAKLVKKPPVIHLC